MPLPAANPIARCTERRSGQPYTRDYVGATASRVFEVIAQSEGDALETLDDDKGVRRGAIYKDHNGNSPDPLCVCQNLAVDTRVAAINTSSYGFFIVTAFYSRIQTRLTIPAAQPFTGSPRYWLRKTIVDEPVDHTPDGTAIANSVAEPIDPPLTRSTVLRTLIMEMIVFRSSQEDVEAIVAPYENMLNSVTFRGAARGSLKSGAFDVEPANFPQLVTGGLPAFRVHGEFEHRPTQNLQLANGPQSFDGWVDVVPNRGRRRYVGQDANQNHVYENHVDANGALLTDPVPIDLDGNVLPPTSLPYVVWFRNYDYIDFNTLAGYAS